MSADPYRVPPPVTDHAARAKRFMAIALALVLANVGLFGLGLVTAGYEHRDRGVFVLLVFSGVAVAQLVYGVRAVIEGVRARRAEEAGGLGAAIIGGLTALAAPFGWMFGGFLLLWSSSGGAWGRPLRVRGRQRHPELREGTDWTRGARPDPTGLDVATRGALEALWLHDAQKEHASVPAFSRISWLLAAVGAPADLVEWSHRAALEEIEHTRLCFALAAGYGDRSHSVEPMPELLLGELAEARSPLVVLATESLSDGCQLEDFNADVAAACAAACEEPATRSVLEQVAREERSHADFSWALLAWLVTRDPAAVEPALRSALARLDAYPRPTAASTKNRALVEAADAAALLRHGRLPDERWAELWDERLRQTRRRATTLLGGELSAAA